MTTPSRPTGVRIVEVGPRDGLQNIKITVPSSVKVELIDRLRNAGLQAIEITSIVSPKAIPQLADFRAVLTHATLKPLITGNQRIHAPVLVPNLKGLKIAQELGVREIAVFISASEGFSRANINCSVEEGIKRATAVAHEAGIQGMAVRGYVSSIFACPFDGKTPPHAVLRCVKELLQAGCYEVSLGDTLGVGVPSATKQLIHFLLSAGIDPLQLAGHFHDTYGQAIGNVWAAYECGLRIFDSSISGLGGCPYAPGAKGNLATEDLAYMFSEAGVETGVDLNALVETGLWMSSQLGRPNESRAGSALAMKKKLLKPSPSPNLVASAVLNLDWRLCESSDLNDDVQIHQCGANVKLTLNRPRNGNALTTKMITFVTNYLEKVPSMHPSISRIVIAATGKYFCTGMDLSADGTTVGKGKLAAETQFQSLTRLFEAISAAPQLTIACIQGPAFGGGVGLAFACDIRLASQNALMKLSEVRLGLCPATISKYIVREWGVAFAREAMVSGRAIPTSDLERIGALARTVPHPSQLPELLSKYVADVRGSAPQATTMCKELVRLGWSEAGQKTQSDNIRRLFDEMMRPGSEGSFGIDQLRRGVKDIPWENRFAVDTAQMRGDPAGKSKL